jgi:hypothetical protein
MPTGVANVLALQATVGNRQVANLLSRQLDDKFGHGGERTRAEAKTCGAFAQQVSDFTDQAHDELLAGAVKTWRGAKWVTFLGLLQRDSRAAIVWAGNAIEERVYQLMHKHGMDGVIWVPQHTDNMGGVSFPDIVIHINGKEALVDITSDRRHILGKGGNWENSPNYIYIAEAWFPPVCAEHLPLIKKNIEAGGIGLAEAEKLAKQVQAVRKAKAKLKAKENAKARERWNELKPYANFVRVEFGDNDVEAAKWLRAHGLGSVKGLKPKRGKRKMDPLTKKRKQRQAAKQREALLTPKQRAARDKRLEANKQRRLAERKKAAKYDAAFKAEEEKPEEEEVEKEELVEEDEMEEGGFEEEEEMEEGGFEEEED